MISVILICASLLLALFICVKMVGGKSLDRITARTVGHGQHGTARWANRREIRKYYTLVPYEVEAWRKGEHRPEHEDVIELEQKKKSVLKKLQEAAPKEEAPRTVRGCLACCELERF